MSFLNSSSASTYHQTMREHSDKFYGVSTDEIALPELFMTHEGRDGFSRGRYCDVEILRLSAFPTGSRPAVAIFDHLPTELLHFILSSLDMLSLYRLSQTSHTAKATVSHLPLLVYLRLASRIVTPLRQFGLITYYSIKDLADALLKKHCECCRARLGAFLFLPTLDRACTSCLKRCPRFRMMQPKIAKLAFGMKLSTHRRRKRIVRSYAPFSDLEGVRYQKLGQDPMKCSTGCPQSKYEGELICLSDALRLGIAKYGSFQTMSSKLEYLSKLDSKQPLTVQAMYEIYMQKWRQRKNHLYNHRGDRRRNSVVANGITSCLSENDGRLLCETGRDSVDSVTEFEELLECDAFTGAPRVPILLPQMRSSEDLVWCWSCNVVTTGLCSGPRLYSSFCWKIRQEIEREGVTMQFEAGEMEYTAQELKHHVTSCPAVRVLQERPGSLEKAYRLFQQGISEEDDSEEEW